MGQARKTNQRAAIRLPPLKKSPSPNLYSPKETKWTTGSSAHVGQFVMWGTQETLKPLSKRIPEASERVRYLSKPKKNFQADNEIRPLYYYSAGRPTAIWDVNPAALDGKCSPRLGELANPKPVHMGQGTQRALYLYSTGRPSVISLTPSPVNGACSPRLKELARPKVRKDYDQHQAVVQPMNISSTLKR